MKKISIITTFILSLSLLYVISPAASFAVDTTNQASTGDNGAGLQTGDTSSNTTGCSGSTCSTYKCRSGDGALLFPSGEVAFRGVYPTCYSALSSSNKSKLSALGYSPIKTPATTLSTNTCLEYIKVWRFYGTISYNPVNSTTNGDPNIKSISVSKLQPPAECEDSLFNNNIVSSKIFYYPNPNDSNTPTPTGSNVWNRIVINTTYPHDITQSHTTTGGDTCYSVARLIDGNCTVTTNNNVTYVTSDKCDSLQSTEKITTADLSNNKEAITALGVKIPVGKILQGYIAAIITQKQSVVDARYSPEYIALASGLLPNTGTTDFIDQSKNNSNERLAQLSDPNVVSAGGLLPSSATLSSINCSSVLNFIAAVKDVPKESVLAPQPGSFTATCALPVQSWVRILASPDGSQFPAQYAADLPNGNVIGKYFFDENTKWDQVGKQIIPYAPISNKLIQIYDGTRVSASTSEGKSYTTYLTNLIASNSNIANNTNSDGSYKVIKKIVPSKSYIDNKQIYAYYETGAAKSAANTNPLGKGSAVLNNIYCSTQILAPALVYHITDPNNHEECYVTIGQVGNLCCDGSTSGNPTPCPTITPSPTPSPSVTPTTKPGSSSTGSVCVGNCGDTSPASPFVNVYLTTTNPTLIPGGGVSSNCIGCSGASGSASLVKKFIVAGTSAKQSVTLSATPKVTCDSNCQRTLALKYIPASVQSQHNFQVTGTSMVEHPETFKGALATRVTAGSQSANSNYNICTREGDPKCSYIAINNGSSSNPKITYEFNSATNDSKIYTGVNSASMNINVKYSYSYQVWVPRTCSRAVSGVGADGKPTVSYVSYDCSYWRTVTGNGNPTINIDKFYAPGAQSIPVVGSVNTGR